MTRGLKLRVRPGPPQSAGPAANEPRGVVRSLSDAALLDGLRGAGSQEALCELFRRHGSAVHRLGSLLVADQDEVDHLVEDVFVTLWRRSGQLEDEVGNVRLGLLAMAWRRTGTVVEGVGALRRHAAISPLQWLPAGDREVLALTVLAAATITEVAIVLQADRREVCARLRSGLRSFSV